MRIADRLPIPPDVLRDMLTGRLDPDSLDNFDWRVVRSCAPLVHALCATYFRATVTGLENVPDGAAMLVGNHNAGITFLEPFAMGTAWYSDPRRRDDPIHGLGHDAIVGLPVLGNLLMKVGALRATPANGRRVLDAGRKLLVYPGGNHEAFRPWSERHKVDFGGHTGFARLALERDAPIVPVANVGGHDSFIVLHRGEFLARLLRTDRLLRSRSFPVALALPWGLTVGPVFHLPPPVKFDVRFGEAIRPSEAVGHLPAERRADALRDLVVARIQRMIDDVVASREQRRARAAA